MSFNFTAIKAALKDAGHIVSEGEAFVAKDEWRMVDSKVLTRTQREAADIHIRREALAMGLGWVNSEEVDKLGLTAAVRLAMRRALDELLDSIDGGLDRKCNLPIWLTRLMGVMDENNFKVKKI